MSERDLVRFGNTEIQYTVVRSRRRKKTVQITLDHSEGVVVAAPERTEPERIRQIVLARAGWILRRAPEAVLNPRRRRFVTGESLPYLGRQVPLAVECSGLRRVEIAFSDRGLRIAVPARLDGEGRQAAIEAALVRWYRERAAEDLSERVARWSRAIGLTPTAILVRDQRHRWGSCSPSGVLRFNWRIVMAPPAVIDYLVVHELVHLRVRGHSAAYWAEVGAIMPDYDRRRARLREIGPELAL